MKEQNAERLSEYEKAQIEFAKGKAEFLQGCGGCLMIPIIIIILLCIVILIGLIASPFMDYLNSAVFFLVRKFYMLRCLFGTLYVDMRCFGVSCFFSKHKIPHPNQWGILKPQRNTVYSRKTSE